MGKKKKATLTMSEGSMCRRATCGQQRWQTGLKLMLSGEASVTPFANICHVTLDTMSSFVFVFFLQVKEES